MTIKRGDGTDAFTGKASFMSRDMRASELRKLWRVAELAEDLNDSIKRHTGLDKALADLHE